MPSSTKIRLLRQRVIESAKQSSPHLVGSKLSEAGVLDRAVLNRQIAEILDGLAEQTDLGPRMERSLRAFLKALAEGDVSRSAKHVCALLSLQLDDLRRAAVLSLMVRIAGKRKFDPVATYILQNRKVLVTGPDGV
jgi:hypothetical protein